MRDELHTQEGVGGGVNGRESTVSDIETRQELLIKERPQEPDRLLARRHLPTRFEVPNPGLSGLTCRRRLAGSKGVQKGDQAFVPRQVHRRGLGGGGAGRSGAGRSRHSRAADIARAALTAHWCRTTAP